MVNKDNYVPWSSRLLRYAKIKPNGKLLVNSILHGPYVRLMIVEPGDPDRDVLVAEYFHEQTDNELTEKEAKQMEADDQARLFSWEKEAKLFNELEKFRSTRGESIESYYHHFANLMNDFK
ncbi:hypothetical protein Tco_0374460 [Tanacetum coccineum]